MNRLHPAILLIVGASPAMGLKIGVIPAALAIFVGIISGGQLSDDMYGPF